MKKINTNLLRPLNVLLLRDRATGLSKDFMEDSQSPMLHISSFHATDDV